LDKLKNLGILGKASREIKGYGFGIMSVSAFQGSPYFTVPGFTIHADHYGSPYPDDYVPAGEWVHLAVTKSGTTSHDYKIYKNGVMVAFKTNIVPDDTTFAYEGNLVIGKMYEENTTDYCDGDKYWFRGLIDEVEIFNRALSASEILAIYNAGSAGKCKACDMVPFVVEKAKIEFKKKPYDDKIHAKGKFELGSCGVDIFEDVTVTIKGGTDSFTETITMYEKGHKWEYKRLKEEKGEKGIQHMKIDWKHYPKAKFDIHVHDWELDESMWNDPDNVTVSIQIGNSQGSETISMKEKKHHWEYKKKKH